MRSIEDKLQHFPLSTGINQAGGTRGSAPGTLEYAVNCRIQSSGRLQRRCGSAGIAALSKGGGGARAVSNSTAIPRPVERPAFATSLGSKRLVGTTAGDLFHYDGTFHEFAGSFSASQPVGRSAAIAPSNLEVGLSGTMPAVAVTTTGYTLVGAVTFNSEVVWTITNPDGAIVYRGEGVSSSNSTSVRAVAQGTKLILVVKSGTDITGYMHETSTGVVSISSSSLMTLNGTGSNWDATGYDTTQWFLIGRTGASTATVQTVAGITAGATTTVSTTGEAKFSLYGDATNTTLWVGYLDDPSGSPAAGFTALPVPVGPPPTYAKTTIISAAATDMPPLFGPRYHRTATADTFFVIGTTASSVKTIRYGNVVSGTVTPSPPYTRHHVVPVTKPEVQQAFWVITDSIEQNIPGQFVRLRFGEPAQELTGQTLVVDLSSALDAGHYATSDVGKTFHAVAYYDGPDTMTTFVGLPIAVQAVTYDVDGSPGVSILSHAYLYEYECYNQSPQRGYTAADELIVAGQPTSSDGLSVTAGIIPYGGVGGFEIGIFGIPRVFSATASPDANGIAAGTYQYTPLYIWTDRQGRKHVSTPGPTYTVTLTEPSTVDVVVSTTRIGQRDVNDEQEIATVLYRTLDGGELGQLLPYAELPTSTGQATITDETLDVDLAPNEFLPTAGGVLPVRLAPACRFVKAAEERLWCGGLWDRTILEASRIRVPGEPYHFTQDPSHQVVLPDDCTGLAYQDGQIVAFTETAIYLVGGDGPNDQGAGTFLPPRAYMTTLGCPSTESGSILETEMGIFFRSKSSWWIIPRGFGNPVDIGAEIQEESPHCIASAVTESTDFRLARFLVGAVGDTSGTTILAYDLANGQWFRDTYGSAMGTIGRWPEGLVRFRYSLEDDSGSVAKVLSYESEALVTDNETEEIAQSFRTNWIYPWGPGGWGKLNKVLLSAEVLGTQQTLTITVETDADSYAPDAWTIVASSESLAYRLVQVPKPRCTCYRVTVAQGQAAPETSTGFRFLALTTELEPDGGIRPVLDTMRG